MAARKYNVPDYVQEVIRKFDEVNTGFHATFRNRVDRWHKSYNGLMDKRSEAARWTSQLHPPVIHPMIETIVANLVDENLRVKVTPSPKVNLAPNEIQDAQTNALIIELMLGHFWRADRFNLQQRPFFLQQAIAGMSVGQCSWLYEEGPRRYKRRELADYYDENGVYLATIPQLTEEYEDGVVLADHPHFEVVDVRDFFWPEAAKSLDDAPWVIHRKWYDYDELLALQKAGYYQNVEMLKESLDFTADESNREQALWKRSRTKNRVEVLEFWSHDKMCALGNRVVPLREVYENQFWHGKKPFVVCSSMPDLFTIPGKSEVELVCDLQEMLWEFTNQRIDNVRLLNNFMLKVRSDYEDLDNFEFGPGQILEVDDTSQVDPLVPPYQVGQISLESEDRLMGQIQNITGGGLFMSGANNGTQIDQTTATGVSIVTSLAQKRLAFKKYIATLSLAEKAWFDIKNAQQFLEDDTLLHIVGADGATHFLQMSAEDIQGEFVVELEPMSESLMRQERRAEANALTQMLVSMAPVASAVGQPLNIQEIIKHLLEAYDIQDTGRFFSQQPQAQMAAGAPSPGQSGQPPTAQSSGGVTAPPGPGADVSSDISLAPGALMQRAQALNGGVMNAG